MSPELVVVAMFGSALAGIIIGFPLAMVLGGIAVLFGLMTMGESVFVIFRVRVLDFITNYVVLAGPLFIFMGVMVERSQIAARLYSGLHLWSGGLRGGLAIATIFMGTMLAACVGNVGGSILMIGLIATPSMGQRGYNKELICGSVCAGGCLGILIPPSTMLVFYGVVAGLSVGKLFMGAFGPGLLLSGLYISYIVIVCWLRPKMAPLIPAKERAMPLLKKIHILLTSVLPPVFLILAVLGSIFFGIAAPTEAAAIGALASVFLAMAYRRFNWQALKETVRYTSRITCMAFLIAVGATMFTGVFLRLGGGEVIKDMVLAAPGGRYGAFAIIMFVIFILGMFVDWHGILFMMVPLATPIGDALGFDPLWFAIMICVNLQMSFMTPPFAFAIFYLRGIVKPEWGITTAHIIRGVIPFIILIMVGIGVLVAFPQIILWLPSMMIK